MNKFGKNHILILWFFLFVFLGAILTSACHLTDNVKATSGIDKPTYGPAQWAGRLGDDRLVECSGMDVSLATNDLLWAINDSGQGPFVYAMEEDGRSRGRVRVVGAQNRDWEGIDTFLWKGRPMILIADFGDNRAQHELHTLYIIEEPVPGGKQFTDSSKVEISWRTVFSYPDQNHDAESVAVDAAAKKVYVLTKRDKLPLLFEIPLKLSDPGSTVIAKNVATVGRIPLPSKEDLLQKYGKYRSQPTAMDFSHDGRQAVVLTHKHAYLFNKPHSATWSAAFSEKPVMIPLPHPQDRTDFRQREAICFAPSSNDLLVTSEGLGAGIFRLYRLSE